MWYVDIGHHGTGQEGNYSKQEEAIIDSEAMRLVGAGSNDCSASRYDQCYAEQNANDSLRSSKL